jgi:hypothetical protein
MRFLNHYDTNVKSLKILTKFFLFNIAVPIYNREVKKTNFNILFPLII